MNETVIENWLINANELAFTIPFCQILTAKGLTILKVSHKKATLEQGKDVIALDGKGGIHCYQLKGGRMTLARFRREVIPEIYSLLNTTPVHPSIEESPRNWKCYLVLNCELIGEAGTEIQNLCSTQTSINGNQTLKVIARGQLLKDFIEHSGKFMPTDVKEFGMFLQLYNSSPTDLIDKKMLALFYESYFANLLVRYSSKNKKPSTNAMMRQLDAILVITSYILGRKYKEENYHAIVQTWLVCLQYVLAVAEKNTLPVKKIESVINLTMDEVCRLSIPLGLELKKSNPPLRSNDLEEAIIFRRRFTEIVCICSALILAAILRNNSENNNIDILKPAEFMDWIMQNTKYIEINGEEDVPGFISLIIMLAVADRQEESLRLMHKLLGDIAGASLQHGIPNPYYNYEEIIRNKFSVQVSDKFDEIFQGSSYSLKALIMVPAFFKVRECVEPFWEQISHLEFMSFQPEKKYEWFIYRNERGVLRSESPALTQSWQALAKLARTMPTDMPSMFQKKPFLILLLWSVYPHRFNDISVRFFLNKSLPLQA